MEFVIATNNTHKLIEICRMLTKLGHTGVSLAKAGLDVDPQETGTTFAQNALIKAQAVCNLSGRAAIADDSGLVVDALGGAPGVHSARYAGPGHNDAANNQKLLAELDGVPQHKRTGRFVSAVVLVLPSGAQLAAQGACEGLIGFKEIGANGFGYDPLFYVNGQSFAQMSDEQKDAISHRGRALQNFGESLPEFLARHQQ